MFKKKSKSNFNFSSNFSSNKKFNSNSFLSNGSNLNSSYPYTILLCLALIGCFILQLLDIINTDLMVLDTSQIIQFQITNAFLSLFFHASALHFALNLTALFIFSRKAEQHIGVAVLFLFVLGGALANVIASFYAQFIDAHYLAIGASAGIAPLLFISIIYTPFTLSTLFGYFIILFDIFNLTNQNTNVNHSVHFIGYLSSFILMAFISFKPQKNIYFSLVFHITILAILYFIITNFSSEIVSLFL